MSLSLVYWKLKKSQINLNCALILKNLCVVIFTWKYNFFQNRWVKILYNINLNLFKYYLKIRNLARQYDFQINLENNKILFKLI
jgi:hypothetical protein